MADDVLFTVDAAQIIAKLHFAGLQQVRHMLKDGFIINTGILDDDPKGTPEKLGKTRFDLKNNTSTYQFGYVADVPYAISKSSYDLQAKIDDLQKFHDQVTADIESKKLLSSTDPKDKKNLDELKNKAKSIIDDAKSKDIAKKLGIDKIDLDNAESLDKFISGDSLNKLKSALNSLLDAQQTSVDSKEMQAIDDAQKYAFKIIRDYMLVFAGADNVNVDENQLGIMQVSNSFKSSNDKGLVKMFEIQPISDQEKAKVIAAAKADPKTAKLKLCFYVQYTLNVEK